jgi:hypothetical protein
LWYKLTVPTVLRIEGLRVVIWPNDHRPAHVHVIGPDREAVFNLNCPDGPPELRESFGFKLGDLNRIADALLAAILMLCAEWRAIHGDY